MEITEVLEWALSTDVKRILFEPVRRTVISYELLFLPSYNRKGTEQFGFLFKGFHVRCSQSTAPHDDQSCHEEGFR